MSDKGNYSTHPEIRIISEDLPSPERVPGFVNVENASFGLTTPDVKKASKNEKIIPKEEKNNVENVKTKQSKSKIKSRMRSIPKHMFLVQCCLAQNSSLEDVPEESSGLQDFANSELQQSLVASQCSNPVDNEIKNSLMLNQAKFGSDSVSGVSSCKCIRREYEFASSCERDLNKGISSSQDVINSELRQRYASSRYNTFSRSFSLSEWHIPFDEITLEALVARTFKGPVYRGRWHGEVMVYRSKIKKKEEFFREISLLNSIRHENIILFMGACIDTPEFALITSVSKGYTLYTHLHEKKTIFNNHSKLSIVTQIAQGMEYLHSKRIELGKLCSRNVFLESKVKIGITYYINKHIPIVKECYGYIPDRQILYYSPEQMRCLKIKDKMLHCEKTASMAGDIYAYGTILYEIFLEVYPHEEEPLEVIIWNFSCGRKLNSLERLPMTVGNELLNVCWKFDPSKRPSFQQILEALRRQQRPRLRRQHSISQPNGIDQIHIN